MTVNDTEAHSPPFPTGAASPAEGEPAERSRARERHTPGLGLGPKSAAALISVISVLVPVSWSGLWAPYELEVADFSRRIAVGLHGADALGIAGANNTVPTLTELGKGQLPFSSVALGFQLLGLSDWAGRLPLALWALAGIATTFVLVSKLFDRVAAAYAAIALATTPLYFLHARTMLGDGVTLAAVALATCGLGLCVFRGPDVAGSRVGWALLGLLGLAAGFGCRGLLLGVAVPALGIGLAWAIWRLSGSAALGRTSDAFGAISLGLGAVALGVGVSVMLRGSEDAFLELLGARPNAAGKLPTHDAALHQLGFGLFPWSAIAPFSLLGVLGQQREVGPSAALRTCLVSVVIVALALHGVAAPFVGVLPFVGTFAVAALIGITFREAEQPEQRTRLLALSTAALLIVFLSDLRGYPEESLRPFALADAPFPDSFMDPARVWLKYGTLACLLVLGLSLGDLPSDKQQLGALGSDSRRWLSSLREGWHGRLRWVLGALALVLGLLSAAARLASRGLDFPFAAKLENHATLLAAAFVLVPALVFGPALALLVRDGIGAFLRWLPLPRARVGLIGFAGLGMVLSLGYYPELASHVSPRNVFESFRQRARAGEPLAVLGQAAKVAPYYAGADVQTPANARAGLDFLLQNQQERRWLVFGAKDLGALNQMYRQKTDPPRNLPILDAVSSEVLLASNQLLPGEVDDSPLTAWVSNERPSPARPLDVDLNGQLRCLGWAVTERDGTPVSEARTSHAYDFRIYYEVIAPLSGNWKTFIHIDGNRRRFNGDHDTLDGKYPFRFWQKGDYVTDVFPFELEPHFAGTTYDVYFGLFAGDKRLAVKRGQHSDNRIMGGQLTVR
jgi:hypothetical protein